MANKRTIVVTGCSSGIGAYCARALKAGLRHSTQDR